MKQHIGTMLPIDQPVTDLTMVFNAVYNVLYEKLQLEPTKGIVVSKGNPNQRKATWGEILDMAHMLEDFFIFRQQRTGCKTCELCKYWESISTASPHIGKCTKYNKDYIHKFNSCKKGFKPKEG